MLCTGYSKIRKYSTSRSRNWYTRNSEYLRVLYINTLFFFYWNISCCLLKSKSQYKNIYNHIYIYKYIHPDFFVWRVLLKTKKIKVTCKYIKKQFIIKKNLYTHACIKEKTQKPPTAGTFWTKKCPYLILSKKKGNPKWPSLVHKLRKNELFTSRPFFKFIVEGWSVKKK